MKRSGVLIWLLILLLINTGIYAQHALEFNGDSDYVALNGRHFAPP